MPFMNKIVKIIKISVSVLLVAAVFTAIGFAFVPAIVTSVDNGNREKCLDNSKELLSVLDKRLNGTEENKFWYDLIAERNSNKLLSALNRELENPVDISSYYIKFNDERVTVLCTNHPQELSAELSIPDNLVHYEDTYIEPQSTLVTSLSVSGRDTYFQNSMLDTSRPEKTLFTDADDVNRLFPDIYVTAKFAGGGERVLENSEYTILIGTLDLTKTGTKTLRIVYNDTPLETMFTTFDIEVIPNNRREPLIVDGGIAGKYELASWVWTDYVADALDASGGYMDFTASIVFDNGVYYYFPDGFAILKDNEDNGTIEGAVDVDNHKKPAYFIIFDTRSIFLSDTESNSPVHEGSLKVADGVVYIWQTKKSKEFPRGWLQVFCEMKRLDEK